VEAEEEGLMGMGRGGGFGEGGEGVDFQSIISDDRKERKITTFNVTLNSM
jgi:hypothetical protein